ncbi:MAG: type II toxin-antitoxin system RelE/ParE family toxin [Pirellulales bacterium]|nr:type II toxin-antitoxin system RelE/ParE family toxin [Pirellulales bacterium]
MNVHWSDLALEDIESIRRYIAMDSQRIADRFVSDLVKSVRKLRRFPEIGEIVREVKNPLLREIHYFNYRILYRIARRQCEIITILHASRDLSSLRFEFE